VNGHTLGDEVVGVSIRQLVTAINGYKGSQRCEFLMVRLRVPKFRSSGMNTLADGQKTSLDWDFAVVEGTVRHRCVLNAEK
jgi:hypothetical protein